jgi:hypothetical protein|tara:strand:+ start:48 stop:269 length:222 start_codon:yes stop_codon:yes gene_type:complete
MAIQSFVKQNIMKTLRTITLGKVEIRLDQVSSNGTVLGYMISKFEDGLRYYLSSPTTIEETKEHFAFYINVYK